MVNNIVAIWDEYAHVCRNSLWFIERLGDFCPTAAEQDLLNPTDTTADWEFWWQSH